MTQDDRDAALGRAVRAKAEAIRRLAELRSHAKMLGARFSNLGSLLMMEPENIRFVGDPSLPSKSAFQPFDPFKLADFDSHEVATLVNEIRAAFEDVERVKAEVAQYGV